MVLFFVRSKGMGSWIIDCSGWGNLHCRKTCKCTSYLGFNLYDRCWSLVMTFAIIKGRRHHVSCGCSRAMYCYDLPLHLKFRAVAIIFWIIILHYMFIIIPSTLYLLKFRNDEKHGKWWSRVCRSFVDAKALKMCLMRIR